MFGVGAVNLTPTQRKAAMAAALGRRPAGPPPSPLTRGLGSRSLVPVNKAQAQANAVNKYTGLNLSGEEEEEYEDEEEMKTPPRSSSANTNARAAFAPRPTRKEQGGSRRKGHKTTRRGRKSTRRSRKSTRRGRKSTRRARRS
jgi:hypothetical protein